MIANLLNRYIPNLRKLSARELERLEARLSFWVNIALGVMKILAGFYLGILALLADGIHSFADLGTSAVVYISSIFADAPRDEDHPYGHGKALAIGELIMSILLLLVVVEMFKQAIKGFNSEFTISEYYSLIGISVALISVVVKEILAQISMKLGAIANSNLLFLDGVHHRVDALSSLIALVGVIGARYGLSWLDSAMSIAIGLMIAYVGLSNIKSSIDVLMDKDYANVSRAVKEIAKDLNLESYIKKVFTRKYGDNYVIEVQLEPPSDENVGTLKGKVKLLSERIRERLKDVGSVHYTISLCEFRD